MDNDKFSKKRSLSMLIPILFIIFATKFSTNNEN